MDGRGLHDADAQDLKRLDESGHPLPGRQLEPAAELELDEDNSTAGRPYATPSPKASFRMTVHLHLRGRGKPLPFTLDEHRPG
jgi:hypothetical protein